MLPTLLAILTISVLYWLLKTEFLLVVPIWVCSRVVHFVVFSLRRRRAQ